MATTMTMADLDVYDTPREGSQRVAVLRAPGRIETAWADVPEPGDGEVRVKIKYVGVCGSDVEAFRGNRRPEFLFMPVRLGHEVAGTIDRVGPNAQGVAVGDRVTCRYVWGAFAQYIVCRPFHVKALPERFPMKETSLVEILPGVIHAAELADIDHRTSVLVTGQGVSGLVLTQVLALYSPKALAVTDLKPGNLELARKYGATHAYRVPSGDTPTMDVVKRDFPDGFDVVVPCLLDGEGMIDALDCCTTGAKIVMYGCIGVCHEPFDFFKMHRKRATIVSTEPRRDIDMRRFFDQGVGMVLDGLVNTGEMITHIVPLTEIDRAFALRHGNAEEDSIHVLVDCEAPSA